MEDQHLAMDNCLPHFAELPDGTLVSYWAVYDGHGGTEAALLVKELLLARVIREVCATPANVEDALKRAFAAVDAQGQANCCFFFAFSHVSLLWFVPVLDRLGAEGDSCGSTAAVALLIGKSLYVANVGDAEVVLGCKDGTKEFCRPDLLTVAHKVSVAAEKERITALGGKVFAGRIFGKLAVARAFGDGEMKKEAPYVSCEPHVSRRELTADDLLLVLACDGLWDRVTHDECAKFVGKLLRLKSLEDATSFLVEEALDRNTKDNVTVCVVQLGWAVTLDESEAPETVALNEVTPGFVSFLKTKQLLTDEQNFSQVAARINSPIRERQRRMRRKKPGASRAPASGSSGASSAVPGEFAVGSARQSEGEEDDDEYETDSGFSSEGDDGDVLQAPGTDLYHTPVKK